MEKARNIKDLKAMIAADSTLIQKIQQDPLGALDEITDPRNDPKIFRTVLYFVGGALLISLIVGAVISLSGPIELMNAEGKKFTQVRGIDQFFVMIGSAAIGALAGLLVPAPE